MHVSTHHLSSLVKFATVPLREWENPSCADESALTYSSPLLCYRGVFLSAFWHLHCLVVYLYHISSFIKNSVSGAVESALESEVYRLLRNHPPLVPSGAAPALAALHWAPKAHRGRKTKEGSTEERLLSRMKVSPFDIVNLWINYRTFVEVLICSPRGVCTHWHWMRSQVHTSLPGRQTTTSALVRIWKP